MERVHFLVLIFFYAHLRCAVGSNNVPGIFIFGDSTIDAGNNRFIPNCTVQADFPPYGITFFHHPTGRFTDGRTVSDFISEFLELPLQKPLLEIEHEIANGTRKNFPTNGINFASAGSGVLPATNSEYGVIPIQVQLQQFKTLVEQNRIDKKLVRDSLFFIQSGNNDLFGYFIINPFDPPTLTPNAYVQSMVAQVEDFVDTIYKLGARRISLFGLGPVGCIPARALLPGAPVRKCYGKMNRMVKVFNTGLENIVTSFPVKYSGAIGVFGATYEIFHILQTNPKHYGFNDIENACCGYGKLGGELQCGMEGYTLCKSPNDHLFWDYFHPTESAYKFISKALWAGGPNNIRPFNLKKLCNITLPNNI
ncbi:GDSL esterase/lipase 6 [Striga hermonthica]|uniref:GDSL esterase/lipase 6 n=1 Tax=Striga hermonthica TaxID=68872 RepID=A0A9N7P040_STRHE|nr:GDSL esterase/lipase 6 [Striga hermonthica]